MQTVTGELKSPEHLQKGFPCLLPIPSIRDLEKEGPLRFPREWGERGRAKL